MNIQLAKQVSVRAKYERLKGIDQDGHFWCRLISMEVVIVGVIVFYREYVGATIAFPNNDVTVES